MPRVLRTSPRRAQRVLHRPGHPLTGVPVFRDDRARLLDTPYTAGFLTSPAPNAGVIRRQTPQWAPESGRARRPRRAGARGRGRPRLPQAGARRMGLRVFQNDPVQVAGVFRTLLTDGGRFAGHFEQVVFGILDRRPGSAVRTAFTRVFDEPAGRMPGGQLQS
ncbi:TIGR02452 family protein [Streptomyces sp. M10(2022)]